MCALQSTLNLKSFYGIDNGFTLCHLCHRMYDNFILTIDFDEASEQFVAKCTEGCLVDLSENMVVLTWLKCQMNLEHNDF